MTNTKKFLSLGAMVLTIGAISLTSLAASNYNTPAEAVAGLTGKTVEDVTKEREAGKNYGTIADEAGKLEEFKVEMLEIKKDALNERVEAGTITQEEADEIIANIEENSALCDGTGSAGIGSGNCLGNGQGNGQGTGQGNRQGNGQGRGQGGCSNRN